MSSNAGIENVSNGKDEDLGATSSNKSKPDTHDSGESEKHAHVQRGILYALFHPWTALFGRIHIRHTEVTELTKQRHAPNIDIEKSKELDAQIAKAWDEIENLEHQERVLTKDMNKCRKIMSKTVKAKNTLLEEKQNITEETVIQNNGTGHASGSEEIDMTQHYEEAYQAKIYEMICRANMSAEIYLETGATIRKIDPIPDDEEDTEMETRLVEGWMDRTAYVSYVLEKANRRHAAGVHGVFESIKIKELM
jgi:hypothetical protein